jgi:hypothetical protein
MSRALAGERCRLARQGFEQPAQAAPFRVREAGADVAGVAQGVTFVR